MTSRNDDKHSIQQKNVTVYETLFDCVKEKTK